jgi:hypothetical protein
MSVFRDAVSALEDKESYILIEGKAIKVKINNLVDDLAKISIIEGMDGIGEITMHIDNIVLVSA